MFRAFQWGSVARKLNHSQQSQVRFRTIALLQLLWLGWLHDAMNLETVPSIPEYGPAWASSWESPCSPGFAGC